MKVKDSGYPFNSDFSVSVAEADVLVKRRDTYTYIYWYPSTLAVQIGLITLIPETKADTIYLLALKLTA